VKQILIIAALAILLVACSGDNSRQALNVEDDLRTQLDVRGSEI